MLADLHPHPRDSRITFDAGPHKYTIDGSSAGYVSVTGLKSRLFEHFDADLVISKMMRGRNWASSKWHGMSREEIKAAWDENRDAAASAGTAMHENIENHLNGEAHETGSKEWTLFLGFLKAHPDFQPFRTEMIIFDEDVKVAGSIDLVCRDPKDDEGYLLLDWKRSKAISTSNRWQKGTHPATFQLDDCNFVHYSLQLNVYKHILQTKYDMKINGCYLVILHPDQEAFIELETRDLQPVVDALWKERAEEVAAAAAAAEAAAAAQDQNAPPELGGGGGEAPAAQGVEEQEEEQQEAAPSAFKKARIPLSVLMFNW